jgi:hypothetical protein
VCQKLIWSASASELLTLDMADKRDYQGGKAYGELKQRQEEDLGRINQVSVND